MTYLEIYLIYFLDIFQKLDGINPTSIKKSLCTIYNSDIIL